MTCSRCGKLRDRPDRPDRPGRYCLICHAAYMRRWRLNHPLTPAQKTRANARSYAGVYKRRGKLTPKPCAVCSSPKAEMHHDDYSKPLDVAFLCRKHHLELHQDERSQ